MELLNNKKNFENYEEKFRNKCLEKISILSFNKECIEKEKIKLYGFSTKFVEEIKYEFIVEAEKSIDRKKAMKDINKYLENEILSIELEKGLFEYSLIHILTKKLQHHYFSSSYYSALYDICNNLDINNVDINNLTLKPAILNGEIPPQIVPFLSPQQLHPKRWISVIQKKARDEKALNSVSTYKDPENKCKKCGCIEFHSYEQQLRSADEPATKFVICIDCGDTQMQN
jgi:DNA-directed RNA polymerase subunit M/transcription elongation factor TFIIS